MYTGKKINMAENSDPNIDSEVCTFRSCVSVCLCDRAFGNLLMYIAEGIPSTPANSCLNNLFGRDPT